MVGACRLDGSCASGTVSFASGFFGVHCFAPAGLVVSCHSYLNRFSRNPLSHLIGLLVHAPSRPLVIAWGPFAAAVLVLPAEVLLLDGGALGFRTDVLNRRRSTMGLADRVAAHDERNRLLVVHGHAAKGLADVPGGSHRIGVARGPFRIHVDEAHLHG